MERGGVGWIALGACLACALLACGEPSKPKPTGPPMFDPRAASRQSSQASENRAPRIERVVLEPQVPKAGEPVRARAEATDPDGDAVRFQYDWRVNGRSVEATGQKLSSRHFRKGFSIEVTVTASDGYAVSSPVSAWTSVGNQRPRVRWVRVQPAGEVAAGMELSVLVDAEDPDGDALDYEYVWLVNGDETAQGQRVFSSAGLRRGDELRARVVASDGRERSEPVDSPAVTVANAAPVIRSQPSTVDGRGLFHYVIDAHDPDDEHALRYRLLEGPAGMSVDPLTGEVTWQAGVNQAGPHVVEIAAEDRDGGVAAQRFELVVKPQSEGSGAAPPASRRP